MTDTTKPMARWCLSHEWAQVPLPVSMSTNMVVTLDLNAISQLSRDAVRIGGETGEFLMAMAEQALDAMDKADEDYIARIARMEGLAILWAEPGGYEGVAVAA